jgi:hypothetical protein
VIPGTAVVAQRRCLKCIQGPLGWAGMRESAFSHNARRSPRGPPGSRHRAGRGPRRNPSRARRAVSRAAAQPRACRGARARRRSPLDGPMRKIVLVGYRDPTQLAAIGLRPQKPRHLVGAVQDFRCRFADQGRRPPARSQRREPGVRCRLDRPALLRDNAGEVSKSTATSDRQIGKCHAEARRGRGKGLLDLGDHRLGQDRQRAPAARRVT